MIGCFRLRRAARDAGQHVPSTALSGHERCIVLSQDKFGQLVGASRQTISQALQALERTGLIKADYRMLTVLDLEGLRRFGN